MTAALEGGEWSAARPGRTLPPVKTRYSFYKRLGGPQGWSGRVENLVPTGTRSRTVQPVAQLLYRLSYRTMIYMCVCVCVSLSLADTLTFVTHRLQSTCGLVLIHGLCYNYKRIHVIKYCVFHRVLP